MYLCVCVYNYCKARKTKFNFMTRRGKSDEILIPCNDCIMFSMRASLPQQIQVLNQMRIIYQVKSLCPKVHCILSESDTDVQSTWAIFFFKQNVRTVLFKQGTLWMRPASEDRKLRRLRSALQGRHYRPGCDHYVCDYWLMCEYSHLAIGLRARLDEN